MKVGTFTAGVAGIVLLASAAASQTPVATDGDTIRMDGRSYRLWGIDAPERRQECPDGWPAGRMALARLQELVRNKYVVCQRTGSDRAGRIVAICRVSGQDLAALGGDGPAQRMRFGFPGHCGDSLQTRKSRP